jgi:hypothetical protein
MMTDEERKMVTDIAAFVAQLRDGAAKLYPELTTDEILDAIMRTTEMPGPDHITTDQIISRLLGVLQARYGPPANPITDPFPQSMNLGGYN